VPLLQRAKRSLRLLLDVGALRQRGLEARQQRLLYICEVEPLLHCSRPPAAGRYGRRWWRPCIRWRYERLGPTADSTPTGANPAPRRTRAPDGAPDGAMAEFRPRLGLPAHARLSECAFGD
jgi:hypothetical protein